MLLQTLDFARIVQVYIIQLGVGGVYYLLIALLILKRSTKRLNKIFSMFFICVASGTIVNVIYAAIFISSVVTFLNILTFYLFSLAMVFLLVFDLILLKSEKVITNAKQAIIIIGWAVLLIGLFIIGLSGGVQVDDATNWKPIWYMPFFLYALIIGTVMIIATYFFAIQIHKQFEDPILKKKWKYYLVGVTFFYFVWIGTSVSNFLANESIRTVWALISLVALLTTYAMYYGVGKQIQEQQ